VSLGGKLIYVFFYATTELHQKRYVVIFGVLILFFVDDLILLFYDLILLFMAFVELLGLMNAFFYCLRDLFDCLCLPIGH
jgi:hypothetical protein